MEVLRIKVNIFIYNTLNCLKLVFLLVSSISVKPFPHKLTKHLAHLSLLIIVRLCGAMPVDVQPTSQV